MSVSALRRPRPDAYRPARLGGLTVPANDADVARMWHETANDTHGGMTQQEAHPR
jgi:hypothetical protein